MSEANRTYDRIGRIDEEFNRFIDNRTFDQWVSIPLLLALRFMGICGLLTFLQVVETLSKPLEVAEDTADG